MSKIDEHELAIPKRIRDLVDERDAQFCRVCGTFQGERRALHHIRYGGDVQGMGGRRLHTVENILTVCWLPGTNDCHRLVHSRKLHFQPFLLAAAQRKGVTVLQLMRWEARRQQRLRRGA